MGRFASWQAPSCQIEVEQYDSLWFLYPIVSLDVLGGQRGASV